MGDNHSESSVLRALRAEARQTERLAILDALERAEIAGHRQASQAETNRPANTRGGRRAAAMRAAIDVIRAQETGYYSSIEDEPHHVTQNNVDAVELYSWDPAHEVEEKPVRLVVCDGGDSTVASAYLSLDEAEEHAGAVLELVEQIRRARAARESEVTGDG